MPAFYVYVLECSDGSYYTGWTTDLEGRLKKHLAKKASKYTRTRLPVRIIYSEAHDSKKAAMQREWSLKQLSRSQKEQLIRSSPSSCGSRA